MVVLSPGLLQGCVELLNLVSRSRLTVPEIRLSFATFSGLPSPEILHASQALKWICVTEEGVAAQTTMGASISGAPSYEVMLRRALIDYVDIEHPPWLQGAISGRTRVLTFAGSKIAQIMVEAGLKSSTDSEVVAFWDALSARARGQRDVTLLSIGRLGERFTLLYEEGRTGVSPKWMSIEDNDDGYDILSIVDQDDSRPLTIETKTSSQGLYGIAHMTRNEWERTLETELHLFHFWDVSNRQAPRLAIVSPKDMKPHIPLDCGSGEWESARIPFAIFEAKFSLVSLPST